MTTAPHPGPTRSGPSPAGSRPVVHSDGPPMGWNSWDCYGTCVTEAEVAANATFMAERLLPYSWDTIVVDIAWYDPAAHAGGYNDHPQLELDAHGRALPAPNRFPSAVDGAGFGPLATRIHDLGLTFGLHIMRGIPRRAVELDLPIADSSYTAAQVADTGSTCRWNSDNFGLDHTHPGAQAYYDSQVAQFAEWGVDFIKADDMLTPLHRADIEAYAGAISRCGRPIRLSLSPGGQVSLEQLEQLQATSTMWRVSGDLWDRWADVEAQFTRMARWAPSQGPAGWADADMLPLGRIGIRAERGGDRHSRLTPAEQVTLMTLWAIARSPLMFGGDLPTSSAATIALLTNEAVLAVSQHSRNNREVLREHELLVWTADATDRPGRYTACFWLGDEPTHVNIPVTVIGAGPQITAIDAWSGASVPVADAAIGLDLPAHGARLLRLQ